MLLNELPERDDELTEDVQNTSEPVSSPSPSPSSDSSESDEPETASEEVETPAESEDSTETPAEAASREAPAEEASTEESPAEEALSEETTPEEVPAEEPTSSEEATPEVPASEETPAAEETAEEGTSPEESSEEAPAAPVGYEEILSRIDSLISTGEPGAQILTDVRIPDLTQLVNWMGFDSNLNKHIGRVNLIRQAFDALKAANSLNHSMESNFREAFATFNRQKTKRQQSSSGVREENATKKRELIQKLRDVVTYKNPEMIGEVRDIQEAWKGIGQVPQRDLEPLYKEYRGLLDEFYELRSVHLELMEYDRKKNLEERERLIEIAKTLVPAEKDRENAEVWREKLDMLQELQQQWKSAGHVPREDMDRINESYRDAIDAFFEVRNEFRAVEDKAREENAEKKNELLAQLETFREFKGESPKDWNEATGKVRAIQEAWKELGPAPSAVNGELWSKYRNVCDAFYGNKSAYFKGLDEARAQNFELKKVLVEKAEVIATRTDWEPAARDLKKLQTEWKSIGPVPDRHSQKLWNKFRAACDTFFEGRRTHYAELHAVEKENLKFRRTLIDEVKALQEADKPPGEIVNAIKGIQARWKESGRVPYKEKEKIWKEFRKEIDLVFNGLDSRRGEARRERSVANIEKIEDGDERTQAIKGKISRIRRKIHAVQEKVDQYSTNIQFISRGKSGDALRAQIQGEIDKEEKIIKDLRKEVKDLNEMLKNPPKKEEAPAPEAATEEAATEAPAPEAAASEEAPAEEAPAETSTEEATAPAEETPAEEAPAADAPAEDEEKKEE